MEDVITIGIFMGKKEDLTNTAAFSFFSFKQDAVVVFLNPGLDFRRDDEQPRYRLLVQNYKTAFPIRRTVHRVVVNGMVCSLPIATLISLRRS